MFNIIWCFIGMFRRWILSRQRAPIWSWRFSSLYVEPGVEAGVVSGVRQRAEAEPQRSRWRTGSGVGPEQLLRDSSYQRPLQQGVSCQSSRRKALLILDILMKSIRMLRKRLPECFCCVRRLVKRLDFGAGPKLLLWKCPTSSCLIQPGSCGRFPVLCAAHHTDLSLRAAGITRMDTLLPALGLFSWHSHLAWTNLPESCCLSPPRLLCVCLPSVLLFFFILCLCICAHKLRRHWTGSEL